MSAQQINTLNAGKDYVLPMEENRNKTSPAEDTASLEATSAGEQSLDIEEGLGENNDEDQAVVDTEAEIVEKGRIKATEREEYDSLVKGRFKDLYAEDTQRLINRRFRKYKIMEERFKVLEETLAEKDAQIGEHQQRAADFEELLRSEVEKAIKETEERIIREIKAKKLRPSENGMSPRKSVAHFDVSRLTKNERATLAKRAASGEKIKL